MGDKWGPLLVGLVVVAVLTGVAMRFRLLPGDTDETQGTVSMALELVYEDGTSRIVDPSSGGALSILKPLSILDDTGKPLSEVNYVVKVKTTYTGTFYAGSIRGNVITQVNDVSKDTHSFNTQPDIPSGVWVRVISGGVTKYALEDWGKTGQNSLRFVAQVTVEIVFEDGTVDSMTGQGGVVVSFDKTSDSGITALSVSVTPSFLY